MSTLPRALRIALLVVAAALVVWVLFTIVFPWVEARWQDPTIGAWVLAYSG